jgi:hypothetical protein
VRELVGANAPPAIIRHRLASTAVDFPPAGEDSVTGAGQLDCAAALLPPAAGGTILSLSGSATGVQRSKTGVTITGIASGLISPFLVLPPPFFCAPFASVNSVISDSTSGSELIGIPALLTRAYSDNDTCIYESLGSSPRVRLLLGSDGAPLNQFSYRIEYRNGRYGPLAPACSGSPLEVNLRTAFDLRILPPPGQALDTFDTGPGGVSWDCFGPPSRRFDFLSTP